MEVLKNCSIIIDIYDIYNISGAHQRYSVSFSTRSGVNYKLTFAHVWEIRSTIENGFIDRFYKFIRDVEEDSGIVLVEGSESIKYFENQVDGTCPVDELKNFLLFDVVDTVVEVLAHGEPILEKLE